MTLFPLRPLSAPVFDAQTEGGNAFGDLPSWDLSDLYKAEDAAELKADLEFLEKECQAFAEDYQGKLADLDAAGFLRCIERNEKIQTKAGRIMSYAGLRYYQNTTDADRAKFMSDMQSQITDISTPTVFFSLEVNRIDDQKMSAMLAESKDLARYKPIIDNLRKIPLHGTACSTKPWPG